MRVKWKKIGIIGLGTSGKKLVQAALRIFPDAEITAFEKKSKNKFLKNKENSEFLEKHKGKLEVVFEYSISDIKSKDIDVILLSSGVKHDELERERIPFLSELDFVSENLPPDSKVILITGTKGKGGTLLILSEMLKMEGVEHFAGGNIGEISGESRTLSDALLTSEQKKVFAFEVSSFQLRSSFNVSPYCLAITNFGKDHIDFHSSIYDYLHSKTKLSEKSDYIVFPTNPLMGYFMFPQGFEVVRKSGRSTFERTFEVSFSDFSELLASLPETTTVGEKANFLCALSVLHTIKKWGKGDAFEFAKKFLSHAKIPKKKFCFDVREINMGSKTLKVINDAKSTNPLSLANALLSLNEKCVLITGGKTKGFDFSEIKQVIKDKVVYALIVGADSKKISKSLEVQHSICGTLEEAVREAIEFITSQKGVKSVLFSPGAASQPDFSIAEERGEKFDEIVNKLLLNT